MKSIEVAATWLFVPGDRPERFAKALDAGADRVIVDLEDAVAPAVKGAARAHVVALLKERSDVVVRINGHDSPWFDDDVAALGADDVAVMLPKATPAALDALQRHGRRPVVALVETAAGVVGVEEVAARADRVVLGNADLAAELGVDPADREALAHVRGRLVVACAAAGGPGPVDGVTLDVRDGDAAEADARAAARHGFTGKLCVHPAQVAPTLRGLAPAAEHLAWARRVLGSVVDGVATVDGQMVDEPVLARARSLLARAGG